MSQIQELVAYPPVVLLSMLPALTHKPTLKERPLRVLGLRVWLLSLSLISHFVVAACSYSQTNLKREAVSLKRLRISVLIRICGLVLTPPFGLIDVAVLSYSQSNLTREVASFFRL